MANRKDTSKGAPDAQPGEAEAEQQAWEQGRRYSEQRMREAFGAGEAQPANERKGVKRDGKP